MIFIQCTLAVDASKKWEPAWMQSLPWIRKWLWFYRTGKMVEESFTVILRTQTALHAWLEAHHRTEKACWVQVRYGRPTCVGPFWYIDAVEEALCFGWIDTVVKPFPEGGSVRKLAPRRPNSHWTELNKERCRRLERLGRMTDSGRAVLPDLSPERFCIDPEVLQRLQADATVWQHFQRFPSLYQRVRIDTIQSVKKQPDVFQKRLEKFINCTREGVLYGEWNDHGRLWKPCGEDVIHSIA